MNSGDAKEILEIPWSACEDSIIATLSNWVQRGLSLDIQDEQKRTVLHIYCSMDGIKPKVVEFLLNSGANPNICDADGLTPLQYLSLQKSSDMLKLFTTANGVNLDVKDNIGWTLLHRACMFNLVDCIQILLENGASPGVKNNDGETPFHFAAGMCEVDVLRIFVSKGANVYAQDNEGRTVLHTAYKNGKVRNMQFLLLNGADVDGQDFQGWTPLMYAIRFSTFDCVKSLIRRGAFINCRARNGDTPLHVAAQRSSIYDTTILTYLLEQGALVGVRNYEGLTAYDILRHRVSKTLMVNPFSHRVNLHFHEDMVTLRVKPRSVVSHILKQKILYPVDENVIADNRSMEKNEVALFQKEVDKIKSTEVFEGFVLYEVVAQRDSPSYLLNKELVQHLETLFQSQDFHTTFPNYGLTLISHFRTSLRNRNFLSDQAINCIFRDLKNNEFLARLPFDVWEKLLSYLTEHELYVFVKAVSVEYARYNFVRSTTVHQARSCGDRNASRPRRKRDVPSRVREQECKECGFEGRKVSAWTQLV